ncbi:MAG: LamG domain-containing protein [Acetobacteraceae bacterium]|nr:LamG domain-containing protein [Acetobacteraceae bacterium]
MSRLPALALAVFASLSCAWPVRAQTTGAQPAFFPVMAKFDGHEALSFPPSVALEINGAATIEFWVYAGWTSDPGYDPAILAYSGPTGSRFAFLITADRQAFGVYAGSNYATVPFNFADGLVHHVAVEAIGNSMEVLIDEAPVGTLDFGFADLPVTDLWIGAMQEQSSFIGQIGQIRIWSTPLAPSVLLQYARQPIVTTGPGAHPNTDSLMAMSSFANPETGGFIFFGTPNMANPSAQLPDPGPDQPSPGQ